MEPNWITHAASGFGGLLSGGLGVYLLFILRSRKQSSDDLRSIIAQLSERLGKSDERIGILEAKVETLHIENIECLKTQVKMQAKIDQLESAKA